VSNVETVNTEVCLYNGHVDIVAFCRGRIQL